MSAHLVSPSALPIDDLPALERLYDRVTTLMEDSNLPYAEAHGALRSISYVMRECEASRLRMPKAKPKSRRRAA